MFSGGDTLDLVLFVWGGSEVGMFFYFLVVCVVGVVVGVVVSIVGFVHMFCNSI